MRTSRADVRAVCRSIAHALTVTALTVAPPVLAATGEASGARVVATVAGEPITEGRFTEALELARRQRFFHGKPPEDGADDFRDEVMEELIGRTLLLGEAERRGLHANRATVREALEAALPEGRRARDADVPRGQETHERALARFEERLTEDDVLRQLEERVRAVPVPSERELIAYHREHAAKFVEPARDRVSLILLAMEPSASRAVGDALAAEAQALVTRLRGGADFDALARHRSDDPGAARGGDMGYLHRGMLSARSESAIRSIGVGEVTDPVRVLEGLAIFKLVERHPPRALGFDRVRARVAELWARSRGDEAWRSLLERLRSTVSVEIDAEFLRS